MDNSKHLSETQSADVVIPKNAKKGTVLVRCSSMPKLAYEYLVRFVDDKAVIGAKRIVDIDFNASGVHSENQALTGKIQTINGITWDCMHCSNDWMVNCTSCNLWSCTTHDQPHKCPYCERIATSFTTIDTMEATVKIFQKNGIEGAPKKALPHRKRLPKKS